MASWTTRASDDVTVSVDSAAIGPEIEEPRGLTIDGHKCYTVEEYRTLAALILQYHAMHAAVEPHDAAVRVVEVESGYYRSIAFAAEARESAALDEIEGLKTKRKRWIIVSAVAGALALGFGATLWVMK